MKKQKLNIKGTEIALFSKNDFYRYKFNVTEISNIKKLEKWTK